MMAMGWILALVCAGGWFSQWRVSRSLRRTTRRYESLLQQVMADWKASTSEWVALMDSVQDGFRRHFSLSRAASVRRPN
jgi:hypothetical protein